VVECDLAHNGKGSFVDGFRKRTTEKVATWMGSGSAQPKRKLRSWVQEAHNRKGSLVDGFRKRKTEKIATWMRSGSAQPKR
jgi:hypothetical protein